MTKKKGATQQEAGGAAESEGKAAPVRAGAETGTVADTRRAPIAAPSQIPAAPATYRKLDKLAIAALSKIGDNQDAELRLAVEQILAVGDFSKRYGELAPDTSQLAALWSRAQDSEAGYLVAKALAEFLGDVNKVSVHDVLQIVDEVDTLIRPLAKKNAKVAKDFAAVLKISDQRGSAIRDGIAQKAADQADQSAAEEPAEPADPAKGTAPSK